MPAGPPPGRAGCGVSVPIEDTLWRYVQSVLNQSVLNYRECGHGNADVQPSELCGFIPTPAHIHSVKLKCQCWKHGQGVAGLGSLGLCPLCLHSSLAHAGSAALHPPPAPRGCRLAYILSGLYLECALLPCTGIIGLSSLPLQSGPPSPLPPTLVSLHLSDSLSPVHALILPPCPGLLGGEPVLLSRLLFPVEKWAAVPSSTVLENWILPHPPLPVWELPGPS